MSGIKVEFERKAHALCRTFSHAWRLLPVQLDGAGAGTVAVFRLRCLHECGTTRTDHVRASSGKLISRKYEYEPEYRWQGLKERPTKDDVRRDALTLLAGRK